MRRFAGNETAISHAEPAFTLADPGLIAEDIDYDPHGKAFFLTSVLEKKIIRLSSKGQAEEFASSPNQWPMLGIKVDAKRNLVWATEVALDGFAAAPKADWGRSAALCFDLRTGRLRDRFEGPAHSALGDLVLTRAGDPIISDGSGGGVYRVRDHRLERIDDGDFISPQTPTMHPDGKHAFIPDYVHGIGTLDLTNKRVVWLRQAGTHRYAVSGIDGLYFAQGSLFATQNGTSPERAARFQLDPAMTTILSEQIIERSTALLADTTHGVIAGRYFYYIATQDGASWMSTV